jgi:RimJ/RimL family protein N-acetyltransferase
VRLLCGVGFCVKFLEERMRPGEVSNRRELRTERLILRRWRESDLEPFRQMGADQRVMEFFPELLTPEASDALVRRIEGQFEEHGFGFFAVELRDGGRFIGFTGLAVPPFEAPFMPAVEIGWRLAAEYWGHGLATEAAREVLRYGFEERGLNSVVSFTVPANVRSRRVMEKLGMVRDMAGDFDHPRLPEGHPLQRHVLYRLSREEWLPLGFAAQV